MQNNNNTTRISDRVGNFQTNLDNDVLKTKHHFHKTGHYPKKVENGIIDKELDSAIWQFQREEDLKPDGWMEPDGETENRLLLRVAQAQQNKSQNPDKKPDKSDKQSAVKNTIKKAKRDPLIEFGKINGNALYNIFTKIKPRLDERSRLIENLNQAETPQEINNAKKQLEEYEHSR